MPAARVCFGVTTLQPDGSGVVGDGLVVFALLMPALGPVVVGQSVTAVQADGFRVVGDGLVVIALVSSPDMPAIVVSDGISGVQPEGLRIIGNRLVVIALVVPGQPPVGVGSVIPGVISQCARIVPDGLFVVPQLVMSVGTLEIQCGEKLTSPAPFPSFTDELRAGANGGRRIFGWSLADFPGLLPRRAGHGRMHAHGQHHEAGENNHNKSPEHDYFSPFLRPSGTG